jgi:hypothetical protein
MPSIKISRAAPTSQGYDAAFGSHGLVLAGDAWMSDS